MLEAQIANENDNLINELNNIKETDLVLFTIIMDLISAVDSDAGLIRNQLFDYSQNIDNTIYYIAATQSQLESKQIEYLDALLINDKVTQIFNPCGDAIAIIDEVIYKTESGNLFIFYSKNGSRRSPTLLHSGNHYAKLDSCKFYVTENNEIINDRR